MSMRSGFLADDVGPRESVESGDRLGELACILAAGVMRLLARKSREISREKPESSLDISLAESGHPTRFQRENGT